MNALRFQFFRKFAGHSNAPYLSLGVPADVPANVAFTPRVLASAGSFSASSPTIPARPVAASAQKRAFLYIPCAGAALALGLLLSGLLLAGCASDRSQRLTDCGGWLFLAGLFVGACATGALAWFAISGCAKGAWGTGKSTITH